VKTKAIVRSVVDAFCRFLYDVPVSDTFTLLNLQGAVRVYDPIPAAQTFAVPLRIAAEEGWIKAVTDEPGAYRRTGLKRSSYAYYQITRTLRNKILCALGDGDFQWMAPPSRRVTRNPLKAGTDPMSNSILPAVNAGPPVGSGFDANNPASERR
jgi:hypothetical protein